MDGRVGIDKIEVWGVQRSGNSSPQKAMSDVNNGCTNAQRSDIRFPPPLLMFKSD